MDGSGRRLVAGSKFRCHSAAVAGLRASGTAEATLAARYRCGIVTSGLRSPTAAGRPRISGGGGRRCDANSEFAVAGRLPSDEEQPAAGTAADVGAPVKDVLYRQLDVELLAERYSPEEAATADVVVSVPDKSSEERYDDAIVDDLPETVGRNVAGTCDVIELLETLPTAEALVVGRG